METNVWSLRQVYRWVSKFKNGQTDLQDKQRPRAPRMASTDAIIAKITDIITNDGRLTIKQIRKICFKECFGSAIYQYMNTTPRKHCMNAFKAWINRLKLSMSVKKRAKKKYTNMLLCYFCNNDDFIY